MDVRDGNVIVTCHYSEADGPLARRLWATVLASIMMIVALAGGWLGGFEGPWQGALEARQTLL